jgi:hypothetical protein
MSSVGRKPIATVFSEVQMSRKPADPAAADRADADNLLRIAHSGNVALLDCVVGGYRTGGVRLALADLDSGLDVLARGAPRADLVACLRSMTDIISGLQQLVADEHAEAVDGHA